MAPRQKIKAGRPKEHKSQAIKEAAKTIGCSESSVRRAVKREENILPSVSRALDMGKITKEQADILAGMNPDEQHNQLRIMVQETRAQTRSRRASEKVNKTDDKTELVASILLNVFGKCKDLESDVKRVLSIMDNEELDYEALVKLKNYSKVGVAIDRLTELSSILAD